jgi:hypothetical protein
VYVQLFWNQYSARLVSVFHVIATRVGRYIDGGKSFFFVLTYRYFRYSRVPTPDHGTNLAMPPRGATNFFLSDRDSEELKDIDVIDDIPETGPKTREKLMRFSRITY